MVKVKIALIMFFISLTSANAQPKIKNINYKNRNVVIIRSGNPLKQHQQSVLPTIILGILTFLVAFLVIFIRIKVSEEIKKRKR